jgi:hypothetical protein
MVALHFYHAIFGRPARPAGGFELFTQSGQRGSIQRQAAHWHCANGWLQSGQIRPASVEWALELRPERQKSASCGVVIRFTLYLSTPYPKHPLYLPQLAGVFH